MMNVLINAVSARSGGGTTYLHRILPALSSELRSAGATTHLLLSEAVASVLGGPLRNTDIVVHTPDWASYPAVLRAPTEQLRLPMLLRNISARALFNVGDTTALITRCPSVILCRNMLLYARPEKAGPRLQTLRALARESIRRASAVAFVSHTMAERVRSHVTPKRWEVIHHGPGLDVPFKHRVDLPLALKLLVVGSLYDYKRVELAIDAVDELRRRGRSATLEIVGRPVERAYAQSLLQRVERLGLGAEVQFAGEAEPHQVAEAYSNATIAIVTSAEESFCHPILEAFAGGLPLLACDDLGVAREIGGEAAMYVSPSGVAIADAVEALAVDPASYRQRVEAGKEQALHFSWLDTARATGKLILSVM
jgi:glycosyltransferase involved in cell wall biosynthesis